MENQESIQGIAATTDLDSHGDRLSKDQLYKMAEAFADSDRLMYWNHETTLPPIGVLTEQWVAEREDGEHQLFFKGYLLGREDTEFLSEDNVQGLSLTAERAVEILSQAEQHSSGRLILLYDPRNFDTKEVTPIVQQMNELVETEQDLYIRKAELPQPVIWVIVSFVAVSIASGFFTRLGEMLAEKTVEGVSSARVEAMEAVEGLYDRLAAYLGDLLKKARPEGKPCDIIFPLSIPDVAIQVEAAVESADSDAIRGALQYLPHAYALAVHLAEQNRPNYFSAMKFLYNPQSQSWDINYLVTRSSNRVILGPRYHDPTHPLRKRYEETLGSLEHLSRSSNDS